MIKVKYQLKDLINRNIHVRYQSYGTNNSDINNKVKVFKKLAKLKCQGHMNQSVDFHGKVLSQEKLHLKYQSSRTRCWKVISKVKFFLKGQTPRSRSQGKIYWYSRNVTRNTHVKYHNYRTLFKSYLQD